jgi:hypothetical protein
MFLVAGSWFAVRRGALLRKPSYNLVAEQNDELRTAEPRTSNFELPTPELRTPNSEPRTPNPELRTPNPELRTSEQ